jgi:hypothetical protein
MNYVAECEQCGTIERGDLETVGDAADDHETFHEVRISRVVTDGGRPHTDTEYYVFDEDRTAVIEGPFQSKRRASAEAEACGPNHIVATETGLELIELTSDRTLRWENEDIDLLTDGGYVPERGSETDSGSPSSDQLSAIGPAVVVAVPTPDGRNSSLRSTRFPTVRGRVTHNENTISETDYTTVTSVRRSSRRWLNSRLTRVTSRLRCEPMAVMPRPSVLEAS